MLVAAVLGACGIGGGDPKLGDESLKEAVAHVEEQIADPSPSQIPTASAHQSSGVVAPPDSLRLNESIRVAVTASFVRREWSVITMSQQGGDGQAGGGIVVLGRFVNGRWLFASQGEEQFIKWLADVPGDVLDAEEKMWLGY